MTIGLNLGEDPQPGEQGFRLPPKYIEAIDDSRMIHGLAIIALVGSVLVFIGGVVAIALGITVGTRGKTRFYWTLAAVIIVLSVLSFVIAPLRVAASAVLAAAMMWRATQVLKVLSFEGNDDDEWMPTRKRAIRTIIFSAIALLFNAIWMTLLLAAYFLAPAGSI